MNLEEKKVSVIIPAYNAAGFIKEAIDSVLNQSYKNIEIIVIDDGSTDTTADVVRKFGEKVKYVYQENSGHAKARNAGLRLAKGDYCAFLDADDYWLPEKTFLQADVLNERPEVGVVHCDHTKITTKGKIIDKPMRDRNRISGNIFTNILLRRGHVGTSTAMFRRECFEKFGMLDESNADFGNEDREFWLRLSKHFKFEYLEDSWVFYKVREKSLSRGRKIEKLIKGRFRTIDKSLSDVKPKIYAEILKRMAYSAVHKEVGYSLLIGKHFQTAREHYAKVLKFWPFQLRPWYGYLRTTFLKNGVKHG